MNDKRPTYESGIAGRAEVRFGGKIHLGIAAFDYDRPAHGIVMAEYFDRGTPGQKPATQDCHDEQVVLLFDNIKSVEMLEQALADVRDRLKRDAEQQRSRRQQGAAAKRIADCDVSVRTARLCLDHDIVTLGDLARLHKTDWLKFRNSGKKSLTELDAILTAHGLTWGMDV